jgi:RNA polymerase sigma-70 factor (ECF subfamily)
VAEIPNEAELVSAASRGDARAFDLLYARHFEWVYRLALRTTGSREDALDVAQETFLHLLAKLPELELTAKLTTYLHPIVVHRALDARRRRGRIANDEAALEAALARPTEPSSIEREDLLHVLRALSAEQREVLLLRFSEGFELQEIAAALAIPLGTVKSRMHQALEQLRLDPRLARFFE